jgi:hypothetical protein
MPQAPKVDNGVRTCGNYIFFGERLDSVGNRLEEPEWSGAIGAKAVLNAGKAFALEDCGEGKERGKKADDHDDAKQHGDVRPQDWRQKRNQPLLEQYEDLVHLFDEGVL